MSFLVASSHLRAAIFRGYRALVRRTAQLRTIRGRILVALLIMSVITAALGGYAARGISRAGVLVARTFDESLMSINYARAASADFAAMQAAFARRWIASNPDQRHQLDQDFENLEQALSDDLAVAAERSQSARAVKAAASVRQAVTAWTEVRRRMLAGSAPAAAWDELDRYATTVDQRIDLLVNYTAGDAFTYRQSARVAVAADTRLNLVGTALAVLLSGLVAWLLARRIIGPVAAASAVAGRIAGGDLDGEMPRAGADELGALLAAMGVMRENIRTMMQREVAQRRSAQDRLADALESSREGVVVVDSEGRIALANSQAADFLGSSPELLKPGVAFATAVMASAGAGTALVRVGDQLPTTGETRLADGRWLRVSRNATQEGGFIVVCSDISVLKEQEARLTSTNLRLDAALDNMSQGLCLYDAENRLKLVNRRYFEIFGLSPEDVRPGMTFREILELSVAEISAGKITSELIAEREDFVSRHAHGTQFQELSQGRVVAMAHQSTMDGGWVATYEDVTERRHAEARIVFMARHDALTNLPNRVLFAERIEQAIAQLERGSGFAVLCLDLDYFKQVNDSLGHPVGDQLLRAVAERLQACAREIDTVARLGGDEFAIVQRDVKGPEGATTLARRIVEVVSAPYQVEGQCLMVGVSIGIALAPAHGTLCETLLKNADLALYRAKVEQRGAWRFFETEMDARLQARRRLEVDLRAALANDELDLHYQPIYDLECERINGFEALLRWQHPTRGMVSPTEFIPIAEEIGLIVSLGEWVLYRACAEASKWPEHVKLAVNVSASQFTGNRLVETVIDALSTSGLKAERMELEITESVLLTNSGSTFNMLHSLRALGVRISMDDFGTGYSSLSYLRSFPVDKIKIDRSFIHGLATPDGSDMIVRAIIGLGRSLGMLTTAEGAETAEQLSQLRMEKCNEVQGYLFSPPVAARHIPELLERWNGIVVLDQQQLQNGAQSTREETSAVGGKGEVQPARRIA
jgi:diguanylate cyclase (GGDEF)-like protein/PAS domain S-box-containing protein